MLVTSVTHVTINYNQLYLLRVENQWGNLYEG